MQLIADFTAKWCGPCQRIAPFYSDLSLQYGDTWFLKVDVDKARDVSGHCGISCMPTFQFFKGGKKCDEMQGADLDKLKRMIVEHGAVEKRIEPPKPEGEGEAAEESTNPNKED